MIPTVLTTTMTIDKDRIIDMSSFLSIVSETNFIPAHKLAIVRKEALSPSVVHDPKDVHSCLLHHSLVLIVIVLAWVLIYTTLSGLQIFQTYHRHRRGG
mmetsp:Transcript_43544/g.105562  ORF Transcript_43544/g.105562 Transcript_43544/m.105562 type:complete len:99 (-) Transcript_43544:1096-1392(-)